eukprot:Gb_37284 [translate_table: standard]
MASGRPNHEDSESEPIEVIIESLTSSEQQDRTTPCVLKVPKTLIKENEEAYVPQVITLGLYHVPEFAGLRDEIELLKTEVTSKMRHRMGDTKFSSMLLMIQHKSRKIMHSYDFQIARWNAEQLLYIMVPDFCIVLEVLTKLSTKQEDERKWPRIDRILNRKRYHPLLNDIIKDMLKMENQLPLWLLLEMTEFYSDCYSFSFTSALKNLSPFVEIKPRLEWPQDFLSGKTHILDLLHEYIVGGIESSKRENPDSTRPLEPVDGAQDAFHRPFNFFGCRRSVLDWIYILLLIPFFPCFLTRKIWLSYVKSLNINEAAEDDREIFRSAENLKCLGIKFRNRDGGISGIEFDIYKFILYLPHLRIDDRTEVVLRNLIALEISSSMEEKPVTRYVHFMSNLLSTRKDVSILRKDSIVTNKLGSDKEASKLLNSITKSIESASFPPIDIAEKGVNIYCERNWQIWWAQFWRIDCSQPWLVVSFMAATLLLLMTAAQVVCLFRSCTVK